MTSDVANTHPAPATAHDGMTRVRARLAHSADADEETVRAAMRGDESATRRLLTQLAPLVHRTCRGAMGREHVELPDVVQESLIEILRALPQFRFEAEFSHYAVRIAIRRAIQARKRRRGLLERFVLFARPFDERACPEGTPCDHVDADERRQLLRTLLAQLPRQQSETIVLKAVLGYSVDEVASIAGVSRNTVKTRLRLARQALRRQILADPRLQFELTGKD